MLDFNIERQYTLQTLNVYKNQSLSITVHEIVILTLKEEPY